MIKFNSLKIIDGFNHFEYRFDKNNLFFSKEVNTAGKTTFLRILLYSLGFNVSSTRGYRFKNIETILEMSNADSTIVLKRSSFAKIILQIAEFKKTIHLPKERNSLHSMVFGIEEPNVLNNILGVFYIDQDNGWSWFVKGTVIGKTNKFDAMELMAGISGSDIHDLQNKIGKIHEHLRTLRVIKSTSSYFRQEKSENSLFNEETKVSELRKERGLLQFRINQKKNEVRRIEKSYRNNNSFINSIEELHLSIETKDGERIPVNKSNLVDYEDNQEYLKYSIKALNLELNILQNDLKILDQELESIELPINTPDLSSLVSTFFVDNNLSVERISNLEKQYKKELKELEEEKSQRISLKSDFSQELFERVYYFANKLNVASSLDDSSKNIFKQNLSIYSGAIKSKIALAYRLAYLKFIAKSMNIYLPIIIDSPRNNEVSAFNVDLMLNLIKEDFRDHQVFIASIYNYDILDFKVFEFDNNSKIYQDIYKIV